MGKRPDRRFFAVEFVKHNGVPKGVRAGYVRNRYQAGLIQFHPTESGEIYKELMEFPSSREDGYVDCTSYLNNILPSFDAGDSGAVDMGIVAQRMREQQYIPRALVPFKMPDVREEALNRKVRRVVSGARETRGRRSTRDSLEVRKLLDSELPRVQIARRRSHGTSNR